MSYLANILVPREYAKGKLGTVMSGCGTPSVAESLASALDVTFTHYLNPDCAGYSVARVTIDWQCDVCRGCGQLFTGKRIRRLVPCKACKGVPCVEVFSTVDLLPATVEQSAIHPTS